MSPSRPWAAEPILYKRWLDKLADVSGNSFIRHRHNSELSLADLEALPNVEIGLHHRGSQVYASMDPAHVEVLSNLVPRGRGNHHIAMGLCVPLAGALAYFLPLMKENGGAGPQVMYEMTQKIASGLRMAAAKHSTAVLSL